jgi:hypothetical protein
LAFDVARVQDSGKHIGRNVYWKLYTIENLLRIIVNSVLTAQTGTPDWWPIAVDRRLTDKATYVRSQYATQPWHSQPGGHDIYYLFLPDLNEVVRANSHLFLPAIPDIDQWMARIEQIRTPRNVVGHMNWPSAVDRKRIDVILSDMLALVSGLASKGVALSIP